MALLDAINKQQQADEMISETLTSLESRQYAVEEHLKKVTKQLKDLQGFMKVSDEVLRDKITKISQQSGQPSPQLENVQKRLSEIEKTLVAIGTTLSGSQVVHLPSGESVTKSDLDSFQMMQMINQTLQTMSQSTNNLEAYIRQQRKLNINLDKLTQHTISVLDRQLAKAIAPSMDRLQEELAVYEERASLIGAQNLADVMQAAESVIAQGRSVRNAIWDADSNLKRLSAKVTWTSIGRMCLALIPISVVGILIAGLSMAIFHTLGVGPLLGWAWESFTVADGWTKVFIGLGAFAGGAFFVWLVWILAKKLGDVYAGW